MQGALQQVQAEQPWTGIPVKAGRWILAISLASCLVFFGYQVYYVTLGMNLHAVISGQAYRSAQLADGDLREAVRKYGIRTVINLRGCCPEMKWYQDESALLHELGVHKFDITFSSYVWPSVPEMRELVEALKTCEYPILVHCRRGADRTGMAAAAVLLLRGDADLATARGQLTWRYGHLCFSKTNVHDQLLDFYETWLAQKNFKHTPALFYQWIMEDYRPAHCWAEIEPLEVPRRIVAGRPVAAKFRVHNTSPQAWQLRQSANCGVHLHYILRDATGEVTQNGAAGFFDATVAPCDSVELTLCFAAEPRPGRYQLYVDMGDEQCCWFSLVGSMPFIAEVEVVDARCK